MALITVVFDAAVRRAGRLLAATLVFFALLVSLIRGLLPQVDDIREQLVQHIQTEYQLDVQIGGLSAQWQAFGASFTISDLSIPMQKTLPAEVALNKVQINIDFWQSLLTLTPRIENVLFDGVVATVDLDRLLIEAPATDPMIEGSPPAEALNWLYRPLLQQLKRFSLSNVSLSVIRDKQVLRPIYLRDMQWDNQGERHLGTAKLYLDKHALQQEYMAVHVELNGNGANPDSLAGQLYLVARSLNVGEWASHVNERDEAPVLNAVLDMQAWLTFDKSTVTSGLMHFSPSWLEWKHDRQRERLAINGGNIHWTAGQTANQTLDFELSSNDLQLATNDVPWPVLTWAAKRQGKDFFFHLNQFDIQNLLPIAPVLPGVDDARLAQWLTLQPKGKVGPIYAHQEAKGSWQASLDITQLQWRQAGVLPSIAPVDIHLSLQDNQWHFLLPAQTYRLDFGQDFSAPLVFNAESLQGLFDVAELRLVVPNMRLDNADLTLDTSFNLDFSHDIHMALSANLALKQDVVSIKQYFPVNTMGESLTQYLHKSIKAGSMHDARIIWQGALADFPFEDNSGVFQAGFSLTNAEYAFQPDWPALTSLSLEALFENSAMDLRIKHGKLQQVSADGAHIFIPDMSEDAVLQVQANLIAEGRDATAVLQASPLKSSVGETLNVIQIQGAVAAGLDLHIPLHQGGSERLEGSIGFEKTPVYIHQPGILLDEVTGVIQFVNQRITGQVLSARLYDQPLTFNVNAEPLGEDFGLQLALSGQWDLASLPDTLNNPLSDFYQGHFSWDSQLNMRFTAQGYQIYSTLSSDLLGVTLSLPAQFAKNSEEARQLTAEFVGDQDRTTLQVKVGEQAEFIGGFDANSGAQFRYFDLLVGRHFTVNDTHNRTLGHLNIELNQGDFEQWLPIFKAFSPAPPDSMIESLPSIALFPPLVQVDAQISDMNLMGYSFTNLTLNARPFSSGWRINAQAQEFDGQLDISSDWATQGLNLVAKKWDVLFKSHLDVAAEQSLSSPLTMLPPLTVNVDSFTFLGKHLGQLALQTHVEDDGYHIQRLSLSHDAVELQGSGIWRLQGDRNDTEFSLSLEAKQFDGLASILAIDPGIKDAPLNLTADLFWRGPPQAFSFVSAMGKIQFDFGKGQLSQVHNQGVRLLSLFSLDSLLRKLSLDFSDAFGNGMYFNSFTGALALNNGVIKTTNTEIDALAGNMKVRGYTNLMDESLHYDIRFVPQLISSLPTVALLGTGVVGVGAFVLTKALEPMIEVISELRFQMTGTMSAPLIKEVARKSQEIEIPESILPAVKEVIKMSVTPSEDPALVEQHKKIE